MTRNDKMKSPFAIILDVILGISACIGYLCVGIFIVLLTGMGNGRK